MTGKRVRTAIVALIGVASIAQGAHGATPGTGLAARASRAPAANRFEPDQVLVHFQTSTTPAMRAAALERSGARVLRRIPAIGWELLGLPAGTDVGDAVATLRGAPGVSAAEPNWRGSIASLEPNDPCTTGCTASNLLAKQWNLAAVNAFQGWAAYPGQFYTAAQKLALPAVKVAVLDTKIHTALSGWSNADPAPSSPNDASTGGQLDLADARDFVPSAQQAGTDEYHGTFVAGILGASANNGLDVAGIGYRAEIVPVTVVDGAGGVDASNLAAGLQYAGDIGARVINTSLALEQDSQAVADAVTYAQGKGALIVAAAGNKPKGNVAIYPAWYPGVMAVGATDEAGRPGTCSNFSPHTTISAPGVAIVSLDIRSSTGVGVTPCGTSTASPHVAGLAAMLFGQNAARTAAQVRSIIEASADDDRIYPGLDDYYGHGRINLERALRNGDGSPVVDQLVATTPDAFGTTPSSITARAEAVAPSVITRAEYFVDVVGAPGTGKPVGASDGIFNERDEGLVADVAVPTSFSQGVHHLYVRAFDGTTWGPCSVTELVVDRTPPQIGSDFKVGQVAAPVAPAAISFTMDDNDAYYLSYVVKVTSDVTGQVLYTSAPGTQPHGTVVHASWTPGATDVGPVTLTVTVFDEAGNHTSASAMLTSV